MRRRIRAERRARTPRHREDDATSLVPVALELPEIGAARCLALYASLPTEPGTGPLRRALRASGRRVLLPVVLGDGSLDWAEDDGDLRPSAGPGGAEPTTEPLGPEGIRQAQIIVVPALAVDTLGNRLGQGAGYYDRALRLVGRTVPVLALVHDTEVLDAAVEPVPAESHDMTVDAALTPRRCLRLAPLRP
ncbi:MAG: 5-formyltetrahydrofolate cyclo-ligase [Actinomycetota bacterium]|nr:5-formyltetrahydrofolate cyclo-ligase [Actinomycetota bacterium]